MMKRSGSHVGCFLFQARMEIIMIAQVKCRRRPRQIAALALTALLFLTAQAIAQDAPPTDPWVRSQTEDRLAFLTTELSLSEQQVPRVREILTEVITQRRELMLSRAPGERGRIGAREEMQEIDARMDSLLSGVLTSDQMSKYQQIRGSRMMWGPRRGAGAAIRPGRGGMGPGVGMGSGMWAQRRAAAPGRGRCARW